LTAACRRESNQTWWKEAPETVALETLIMF